MPSQNSDSKSVMALSINPLFSIVMPTYQSNLVWLKAAIDSVRAQTYPYWELCIADDASTNSELIAFLKSFAEPNIKICFRETNGHIAACSNSALAQATGDFMVLLDHDDVLPPHALQRLAETIAQHPDVEMIYTDEDKISEDGLPIDEPYIKSDWDLDLFLGHNFFNHLGCFRMSSVRALSGFRTDVAGSQDYDLVLRMILYKGEQHIIHIPEILYYWRAVAGSVADEMDAKPYATIAARKAIQEFLDTKYKGAAVKAHLEPAFHEVIWPLPKVLPHVTIIIHGLGDSNRLRRSIAAATQYPHDIVVSQNIKKAAKQAKGEILLFLYAASEIAHKEEFNNTGRCWLSELVANCVREDVAFISPKIGRPDGLLLACGLKQKQKVYSGIRAHEDFGYFGRARTTHKEEVVTIEAVAIRRSVWLSLESWLGCNHIALCKKAATRGYKNLIHGSVTIVLYKEKLRGESVSLLRRLFYCLPHTLQALLKRYLRFPVQLLRRFLRV